MDTTKHAHEMAAEGALPISAAADFLGLGRSRVYQLLAPPGSPPTEAQPIPTLRIGRRRLVPKAALRQFLADQIRQGAAGADRVSA